MEYNGRLHLLELYLKYSLVIIIVLCITACASIKEPKLVSLNNVVMNSSGDSFAVTTDITLYNPNIFALRSKDVKLELFIDSLFIGEILLMKYLTLIEIYFLILGVSCIVGMVLNTLIFIDLFLTL